MAKRDYYEVLSVAREASKKEISDAYRKMAIKFHPDKNPGDDEAVTRFKEAAEAFEVLSDEDKRSRYDRFGHAGVDNGAGPHFNEVSDVFEAFGDLFGGGIFGDIFGAGGSGGGGNRRGGRRTRKGGDVSCHVQLELHEAARGVTKVIEFDRHESCTACEGSGAKPGTKRESCNYCGGQGQVVQSTGIFRVQTTCPACQGAGTRIKSPCGNCRGSGYTAKRVKREVAIPAGVDDQMRVRLTGEGEPSPSGGPPGDCYCIIQIAEHPLFQREGQHLISRVPITYPQATLGATIHVPTLDGPEEFKIPAGTQPGEVFKLRGRGMPDPRHRGTGDLLVQVTIEVPKSVGGRQQELLRELAELEHSNVSAHRKSFFEKLKDYFVPDETESQEQSHDRTKQQE